MNAYGTKIDALPFQLLSNRILEYYDGPLLVEFDCTNGNKYIFSWVDANETCNRWLVFRAVERKVLQYKCRKLSLRNLISESAEPLFLVDFNSNFEHEAVYLCGFSDLPDEYLPRENSFYNPENKN